MTLSSDGSTALMGAWGATVGGNVGQGAVYAFAIGPAIACSLSGTVTTTVGSGLSGVTINLTGTATQNATTDGNGNYSFSGLSYGAYTITPTLAGCTFNPQSLSIDVNGANVTGQNFTADKWVFKTGSFVESSPAVGADGTIYVGSWDFNVYAVNPDGTQKWAFQTGGMMYSTPAVGADGTIYVGSDDYNLYAINPDGTQKWAFQTGGTVWSSPAVGADGTIYVGSDDHNLYAVNPDGTQKWAFKTGSFVDSSPAVGADGTIYVGSDDDNLYAINPDGTQKWALKTGIGVASSPAVGADGTIYVGSDDSNLYAVNPDGTLKWAFQTGSYADSSPAVGADGTIYVGSDYNLYAINPDGTQKWAFQTGNYVYSSPAVGADGTIYVGSWDSNLYALSSSSEGLASSSWPMFHHDLEHTGAGAATLPPIDTPTSSAVTTSTATLGATIESNGGSSITAAGVAYGTGANPDISGSNVSTTATSGAFTVNVTGLTSNTPYHFRGYATNSQGTGYAGDSTFTTVSGAPTATAATGSSITGFTANWTAPTGTATITNYQLDVATDSGFTSFVSGYNNLSISGTSQTVTGLSSGTPYYYRVRAANAGGTSGNSDTITVTTIAYSPPSIDTPVFSSVSTTGATLGATIESNGGASIISAGVAYGTSANPDISGSKVSTTATSGAFTVNVTGLTSNTQYHFRGYATNSQLTGYTGDSTFTTVSGAPAATAATGLSASGFTANWTAPPGRATITNCQLDIATDSGFTSLVSGYNNLSVSGTSQTVTGLSSGTPYYYRVRAVNAGGTSGNSNTITVNTSPAPIIDTPTSALISTAGATLGATIESNGGSSITAAGVAYGTGANPDISGSKKSTTVKNGAFKVNVTALTSNTLYHFRGYATNSQGTGYTEDTTFTTVSGAPTTTAATGLLTSGFTANWTAPAGTASIASYQLDVATSLTFTSFVSGYKGLTVSGTSAAVTGLISGNTYYYRVRAVNKGGTSANSGTIKVTTNALPPALVSPKAGSIGTSRAELGATIESNGGASVTAAGVAYGTSIDPDITANTKSTTVKSGAFKVNVTALTSNTLYHFRGYATNTAGTSYTADSTFTTLAGAPTATQATGLSTTGFTANWAAPPGTAGIASYQLDVATSLTFTSFVSGYKGLIVSGTSAVVTGLIPGKTYYYRVRAVNAGGISSNSDIMTVKLPSSVPAASAGPDQRVSGLAPVKLSGSNSTDVRKRGASYLWTQLDGPRVILADPFAVETGFVAPEAGFEGKSLRFQLTVTGTDEAKSSDNCIVNVVQDNAPPTADAGTTQAVAGSQIVELDGSQSSTADTGVLSYSWRQISGVAVSLSEPSAAQPTFVAPDVDSSGESLVFELTVTDQAGLRSRDTCIVNVVSDSRPPTAQAGPNQTVSPGSRVALDGSGTMDEDGSIVSCTWRQIAGQPVTLSDPAAIKPVFVAPVIDAAAENPVFELTVMDSVGLKDKARVAVTVVSGAAVQ